MVTIGTSNPALTAAPSHCAADSMLTDLNTK
jgi:hypothetical protein